MRKDSLKILQLLNATTLSFDGIPHDMLAELGKVMAQSVEDGFLGKGVQPINELQIKNLSYFYSYGIAKKH